MRFILLLLTILLFSSVRGQVVINEYSASNLKEFRDGFGKTEDWIELYNTSDVVVNLSGWHLSDKHDKPKKWKFPNGILIQPKSFLLVWASSRDVVTDVDLHTNFKFTQSNQDEFVVLASPAGDIIESTPLILTQVHHSIAKSEDGSANWAICTEPTPNDSNDGKEMFSSYTTKPSIITQPGFYKDSIVVTIGGNILESIRYTLDGSLPDLTSTLYTGPITINKSAVLSARSFSINQSIYPGFTDFATFFIDEPASTLPIISIGAGQMVIDLANGNREIEPLGSCEVFGLNGTRLSKSYGELDRHGQDSWVNDQRSIDWISRDEMGHDNGIKQQLFSYSERDEFQRIILRASGDDNYPSIDDGEHEGSAHIRDEYVHTLVQQSGMKMDVRALERYLVYLNGEYWGVYTIREKPDDHDYTEFQYKQDKYDLQFLKTWGNTWIEYGDEKALTDWTKFKDYVLNNDVSKADVYKKITDEMDVLSLMDYMIANLTCVSSDWLNYNTGWWRGLNDKGSHKKWGYIMWDNDATFDYYINYSGVPDTSPDAKACDIDDISLFMDDFFPLDTTAYYFEGDSFFIDGEWVYFPADTLYDYPNPGKHEKIFLKLLEENNSFRNLYFARYADMLNTTYSCESMITILDSLIAIIRPEMPRHIARWGGSMSEWNKNVKDLRDFVLSRCQKVAIGLIDCYDLSGPHKVTVETDPPNYGSIKLNTKTHANLPWSGNYFGNMTNIIEAIPNSGKQFLYWRSKNNQSVFANPSSLTSDLTINEADTLVAVFEGAVNTTDINGVAINIYPNPASSVVQIDFQDVVEDDFMIQLISNDGKTSDLHPTLIAVDKRSIDITHIQPGSYVLKLMTSKGIAWQKLIILR